MDNQSQDDQALRILTRLRDERRPGLIPDPDNTQRYDTAVQLVRDFVAIARTINGYEFEDGDSVWAIGLSGCSSVAIHVARGPVRVEIALVDGPGTQYEPLAVKYDPVEKRWVGTETDHDVAPCPGQRLPRKSALRVLAEETEKLLTSLD